MAANTTLRIDDVATHVTTFRQWVVTPSADDLAAGGSLDLTIDMTSAGAVVDVPDTLTLTVVSDGGVTIRTYTLAPGSASQVVTFFHTADGLSGSSPRFGTVEWKLRATRGGANSYDVETDGAPNDPPSVHDAHLTRGWGRSVVAATADVSNVSFGGAQPDPFQYDESIFLRVVPAGGAEPYDVAALARLTVAPELSADVAWNAASDTFRNQFSAVVDNRFPAANSARSGTASVVQTAVRSGLAWTVLTMTADSLNVDPRLTCEHLFNLDDNTFASPDPLTEDDGVDRLPSQSAFLATNIRAARGTKVADSIDGGVNGLTVTTDLVPVNPGDTVTLSHATASRGTEDGWTTFMSWVSTLPSGVWNKAVTITAPSDITGAAYLLASAKAYNLIVINLNIEAYGRVGELLTGNLARHLEVGGSFIVEFSVLDAATGELQTMDTDRLPSVHIFRPKTGGGVQAWNGSAWVDPPLAAITMSAQAGSGGMVYEYTVTGAIEDDRDLVIMLRGRVQGAPYHTSKSVLVSGKENRHDGRRF